MKTSKNEPLPSISLDSNKAIFQYARVHWRRMNEMPQQVRDLVAKIIDSLFTTSLDLAGDDHDALISAIVEQWKSDLIMKAVTAPAKPTRRTRSAKKTPKAAKDDHECA